MQKLLQEQRRREAAHRRLRWERRRRSLVWWLAAAAAAATILIAARLSYAAKLILAEPDRYGFHIPDEELYQPLAQDRVQLRVRRQLSVLAVAEASGSFYREVQQLNPAITGDALPAGIYPLNLPEGQGEAFRARKTALEGPPAAAVYHRVRQGENFWGIARRYGISLTVLRQRNPRVRHPVIRPGDTLRIR
jgi:hypothetical protein